MDVNYPIFILKRYTGTSKLSSRSAKAFAYTDCSPNFEYPVVDNIEYVPIGFAGYGRSNAKHVITGLNLSKESPRVFSVCNVHTSAMSSNTTSWIDVLFAPSYMLDETKFTNPIFKKRTFTKTDDVSLDPKEYNHINFFNESAYSCPEGYIPFSITKFQSNTTNYLALIGITYGGINYNTDYDYSESIYNLSIDLCNTYTSSRSPATIEIEIVFIRNDMLNFNLMKSITWTSMDGVNFDPRFLNIHAHTLTNRWYGIPGEKIRICTSYVRPAIQLTLTIKNASTNSTIASYTRVDGTWNTPDSTETFIMPDANIRLDLTHNGYTINPVQYILTSSAGGVTIQPYVSNANLIHEFNTNVSCSLSQGRAERTEIINNQPYRVVYQTIVDSIEASPSTNISITFTQSNVTINNSGTTKQFRLAVKYRIVKTSQQPLT